MPVETVMGAIKTCPCGPTRGSLAGVCEDVSLRPAAVCALRPRAPYTPSCLLAAGLPLHRQLSEPGGACIVSVAVPPGTLGTATGAVIPFLTAAGLVAVIKTQEFTGSLLQARSRCGFLV